MGVDSHSTGEADSARPCRKFQRAAARRMFGRKLSGIWSMRSGRSRRGGRITRKIHRTAAWIPDAERVPGPGKSQELPSYPHPSSNRRGSEGFGACSCEQRKASVMVIGPRGLVHIKHGPISLVLSDARHIPPKCLLSWASICTNKTDSSLAAGRSAP